MERRKAIGLLGAGAAALTVTSLGGSFANDDTDKKKDSDNAKIAKRLVRKRVRVYPNALDSFFLATVVRVEGPMIYLTNVKVPLTEPPRDALIDTRSVRLITILGNADD